MGEKEMENEILTFADRHLKTGKAVALVTVTETTGSSPATPGQMIAVLPGGESCGTVGGGSSEAYIINRALSAIKNNEKVFSMSIDHAENGMICGGTMEVFANVLGNYSGICIFGGGHIAQSLSAIAHKTGFFVTIVEDRAELECEFPDACYIVCNPDMYEATDPAAGSDFTVICTRGHETDDKALRYCLKGNHKYIGMIGSKKKVTEIFAKLKKEGVSQDDLDRIYAPIGLDVADSAPAEIAVAILAELLLIKNNGTLNHKKNT